MKSFFISTISILFRIFLVVLALYYVGKAGKSAYNMGYRVFAEPAVSTGTGIEVTVTIPMGSGASEIGKILEKKGLIRDASLFKYQERLSAYHGKLESGVYTLNTAMTAEEMMAVMAGESNEDEEK